MLGNVVAKSVGKVSWDLNVEKRIPVMCDQELIRMVQGRKWSKTTCPHQLKRNPRLKAERAAVIVVVTSQHPL